MNPDSKLVWNILFRPGAARGTPPVRCGMHMQPRPAPLVADTGAWWEEEGSCTHGSGKSAKQDKAIEDKGKGKADEGQLLHGGRQVRQGR